YIDNANVDEGFCTSRGKVVSQRSSSFRSRARGFGSAGADRRQRSTERTIRILLRKTPSPSTENSSEAARRGRRGAGRDDLGLHASAAVSRSSGFPHLGDSHSYQRRVPTNSPEPV